MGSAVRGPRLIWPSAALILATAVVARAQAAPAGPPSELAGLPSAVASWPLLIGLGILLLAILQKRDAPNCICMDLAADGRHSFGHYAVRYWLTDLQVDDPTSSVVRQRIHAALRRAGIPLAIPGAAIFVSEDDPDHTQRKREREQDERAAQLAQLELFASLTPDERGRLAERMRPASFASGEVITREGAVAHWLYVLAKGEVVVRVADPAGGTKEIARMQAPDIFGEMGLMAGRPRRATVVAQSHADCYRIEKEGGLQ